MRRFNNLFFFLLFTKTVAGREQGPPPTDDPSFNIYEYYYDIYINESTLSLPDLDPIYTRAQAVYISGNLVITQRELEIFFKNFDTFWHGIRVNNTNLETLTFIKLSAVDPLDDSENSIEITNNPKLKRIDMKFGACAWCFGNLLITNNPQLDLKDQCDGIITKFRINRKITDNLVDCGCTITGDFNKYVKTMPSNCWMLTGNVTIDQNSDLKVLQEKMPHVTRLNGGLIVNNTSFTDLSFLSSLDLIYMIYYPQYFIAPYIARISIINNKNLTSLGIKAKRDELFLIIKGNPKLCVTPQELDGSFYGWSEDSDLDIRICFDNSTPSHWCQLPESGYFQDLPEGCLNLTGHLLLDEHYNYENAYKLYNVRHIYGSMTINNSLLRTTNMLFSLETISSISPDRNPVYVSNNSYLTDLFSFAQSNLQRIESGMPVVIQNNAVLEMEKRYHCDLLKTRKDYIVKNNLNNCENSLELWDPPTDPTPFNVDVFYGVPKFSDVSPELGAENPDAQNQPGDRNVTDSYEVFETTTENGIGIHGYCLPWLMSLIFALFVC